MAKTRITVAHGDGIGPEIMSATLKVLEHAGAIFDIDTVEIGEKAYLKGFSAGIEDSAWDKILTNKVFLKAPITTPQGGGFKSLNVTIRKSLGLYANVRPCQSYFPYVQTKHPKMNLVIVRENEEDLYAGIEHRQTDEVYQCLKLISRPGSEKIIRYAFDYAVKSGRKKVTCFSKDNIMKMTDGLFHKVFDEIGAEYPNIEKEHWIVDIGAAMIADAPEMFDVVVMPNLYGDILSDVAAQVAGSVGLAGSANIGENHSMFEAIHGSAPKIAGQNIANPSGLLLASVQMLSHIGQSTVAENVHNAWLKTLEDGVHTFDIFKEGQSKKRVSTQEFAEALIQRLGEKPSQLPKAKYVDAPSMSQKTQLKKQKIAHKEFVGVDVFVHENNRDANALGQRVEKAIQNLPLKLEIITNRGVKVYPQGIKETFCTDHWRCRLSVDKDKKLNTEVVWQALKDLNQHGIDVIKTENLYFFDGERGFSLGQGQ